MLIFKQIKSVTLIRFLCDAGAGVPCCRLSVCFETIQDRLEVLHILIDVDQLLVGNCLYLGELGLSVSEILPDGGA